MSPTLTLDKVHEREVRLDPQTGEQRLRVTKVNPYLLLSIGGQPNIFLQSGCAWYEGGERLEPPYPDWLLEQIARCTPHALREVGWGQAAPVPHRSELLSRLAHLSEEDLDALLSLADTVRQPGTDGAARHHESTLPARDAEEDEEDTRRSYDAQEAAEMAAAERAAAETAPSFVDQLLRR